MLPVPYDQMLTPIYIYPQNNPPVVPSIQVHPEGAQLLVSAAAFCANAISEAASTSTTRMFCYNLMSANNWNNKDFFDIVRLVVDYTVYKKFTNSASNIYVTLQQTASEFSQLYASYMASSYQEYFMRLDPQTQQRVIQNNAIFADYQHKADSIYGMQATQSMGMQQPMQHMASLQMNAPHNYAGVHRQVANYPQHQQGHFQHHRVAGGGTSGVNPAVSGLSPVTGHSNTRDNFIVTKFGSAPRKTANVEQSNQTNQGGHVNSNLHGIAYRGQAHTVAGRPKVQKVVPAHNKTEQGKAAPKINISTTELQEVTKLDDSTLSGAFQTIEAGVSGKLKLGEFKLWPYEVTLLNPVISSVETGNLFDMLRECRTLAAVSETMNTYRAKLEESAETDKELHYYANIWLNKLDRFITNYVNQYFKHAMPNGGFDISGIMEDGGDVQGYISSTYSTKANPAFSTYQRHLLTTMFEMDSHGNATLPDLEEPPNAAVGYEILTTRCMVTVLSATASELAYDVGRQPMNVTQDTQNGLFDVLFQINKLAKQCQATKNYLLTLDGKKWVFWESAISANVFTIFEE